MIFYGCKSFLSRHAREEKETKPENASHLYHRLGSPKIITNLGKLRKDYLQPKAILLDVSMTSSSH